MKKRFLRVFVLFVVLLCSFVTCQANSINNITMDVFLDDDGNAKITEVWEANLSQGTEGYRPFTRMGESVISNFSVKDDSGTVYTSYSPWNVNNTFSAKAYLCGTHYIANGIELCWGISKYGNRTYTLTYEISKFVSQYTDAQGIYFNFLNLDQPVGHATITIHANKAFSEDNSKIWAFGNNGTIHFVDGKIVLDSGRGLSQSQYMVALVKIEDNYFKNPKVINQTFDQIYQSALQGVSSSELPHEMTPAEKRVDTIAMIIVIILFGVLFNPIFWIIVSIIFILIEKKMGSEWLWGTRQKNNELFLSDGKETITPDLKMDYWRGIPCHKDLELAFWINMRYRELILHDNLRTIASKDAHGTSDPNRIEKKGMLTAVLLKWIKEGYVTVLQTKKSAFSTKDNNYAIDFSQMTHADSPLEEELMEMLMSASGINKVLEAKELKKWSANHYRKIESWFDKVLASTQKDLESKGLINTVKKEVPAMFGRSKMLTEKHINVKILEEAYKVRGFRRFLIHFSELPEREYFEVHIWEDYLIFAALLGIADKVEEQFSKLYPKFTELSRLNFDVTTVLVQDMSNSCFEGIRQGYVRAESYSSGGGGSSFSGGGGSSGGSSGGGFR